MPAAAFSASAPLAHAPPLPYHPCTTLLSSRRLPLPLRIPSARRCRPVHSPPLRASASTPAPLSPQGPQEPASLRIAPPPPPPAVTARTALLALGTLFFAVCNRVAYKVQVSGAMADYSFFICLFTTCCYVLVYAPVLAFRVWRGFVPRAQVKAALTTHAPLFGIIGLLEAVTFTFQLRAASRLPGSILSILGQAYVTDSLLAFCAPSTMRASYHV
jgi:CRT-like, chloroquine-resistance transporter-like